MPVDPRLQSLLGVWSLDLDASDHGPAPAPRRAISALVADAEHLWVHDRAVDDAGEVHQARFAVAVDGEPRPVAEGVALRAVLDGDALVTEILQGDTVTQRARRHREGDTVVLVQELTLPDGQRLTTRGVYRPEPVKQVIAYRRDLKMRKGKIAAQVAHASLGVFTRRDRGGAGELRIPLDGPMAWWAKGRSAKIVLSIDDEAALDAIYEAARAAGLPTCRITDAGKTEFHGVPTRTTVAVGPAAACEIDPITGPGGLVATKLA